MNAGDLRHRITFETPINEENAAGENVPTFVTGETVWAAIRPASARELLQVNGQGHQVTHTITIRYRNVKSKWRIKYRGRTFQIASIINVDERNIELRLVCHETT